MASPVQTSTRVEQAGGEAIPAILAAQDEEMAPGLSSDGAC